jgi:hypothetical protein
LLNELAEAERYQEAYTALFEQVGSLVARNQLAEEEAERLSKFNAEILGHSNPAQRIAYVDRIRRELAEAKHVSHHAYYPFLVTNLICWNRKLSHYQGNRKPLLASTLTPSMSWICTSPGINLERTSLVLNALLYQTLPTISMSARLQSQP